MLVLALYVLRYVTFYTVPTVTAFHAKQYKGALSNPNHMIW